MKRTDIVHTINVGERVTSIYADTYLDDDYCKQRRTESVEDVTKKSQSTESDEEKAVDEWVSPSDLLIGILDLKAPFTSRINRGMAHQGIIQIGDDVLQRERDTFLNLMTNIAHENDAAWNYILEHEKSAVAKKVKAIYQDILSTKSKILMKEINVFYENSLQELENHLRSEVQTVLISAHANIISDLNIEMKAKLEKERHILENVLKNKYDSELAKVTDYYKILLENEMYRNSKLIKQAIHERNEALTAFYKQIEAQNITSTMYIMCTERKKCKIKKIILDNIQSTDIAEKYQKIKERQIIIDAYKKTEKDLVDINKEWEQKIKKILQLFLKFVSFSLKLLPEQATFLLDLEKMVVLQLNEIQKCPVNKIPILIDAEDYSNIFKFEEPEKKAVVCDEEPFVLEGDFTGQTEPKYGSRDTLPSDVDLPYIRLQRKFIYAKCGKMDEVRKFLDSQRCKCRDPSHISTPSSSVSHESSKASEPEAPPCEVKSESSLEPLLMDDITILKDCPARNCREWAKRHSFPYINSYLDFTEEKYWNVKAVIGTLPKTDAIPDLIDPKFMTTEELPFSATKEPHRNVATQYSSQEDIVTHFECPCMKNSSDRIISEPATKVKHSESSMLDEIMRKRRASIERILNENPKLLKMFTDESFDFVFTIK